MTDNNKDNKQPTTKSREQLIEQIKDGIPQRFAEFLNMSPDDRSEYLRQARELVAGFKSEKAQDFCNKMLDAMEAANLAEMSDENETIYQTIEKHQVSDEPNVPMFDDWQKVEAQFKERGGLIIDELCHVTLEDGAKAELLAELLEIFKIYDTDLMPNYIAEHLQGLALNKARVLAENAQTAKKSLNLSQMSAKSLQTDDCHADTIKGEQLALVLDRLLDNKNLPREVEHALTAAFVSMMPNDDERSINAEVIAELLEKNAPAQ